MRFDLITIFPEIFKSYLEESIIKRALKNKLIEIHIHNLRDYSKDRHFKTDATPYGGGPGMVMTPQPIFDCLKQVKKLNRGPVAYMSPRGKILTQNYAGQLAKKITNQKNELAKKSEAKLPSLKSAKPGLILLCGRYEGIDQRIIDLCVDFELSIGKYVLTGGELPAMVVVDVLSRFVPGVLGDDASMEEESFSKKLKGKKEYPHYTRPPIFENLEVPEVLRNGNHALIKKWRDQNLT